MIMPEKLSLSDFVTRRLHPVKLSIEFLNGALERNTDGDTTLMDASLLDSAVTTLMIFVEDYERLIEKTGPAGQRQGATVERKFVGDETSTTP